MPCVLVHVMQILHWNFCYCNFFSSVAIDDRPFVPSGDSADEEETIDMEEESAAKVCESYLWLLQD